MRRLAAGRLLIVLSIVWVALLVVPYQQGRTSIVDPIEYWLMDVRYRLVGPRAAAPQVVFLAIDDATLEAGQADPVGRLRLARLIHHVADSGAKALVLDVLLADAGPMTERASLAAALTRLPTVIAAAVRMDGRGGKSVIRPHAAFQAQAQVGLVNLSTDESGTPRYLPLFIEAEEEVLPSLPLLAAVSLTGAQARITDRSLVLGDRVIPLDAAANMPLRLIGPAGTVPTISASELMSDAADDRLTGKLVVLGYSAAAMGDRFVTPFDEDTSGAEILATAISQIVGGDTLRRDHRIRLWDGLHATLLTALCMVLMLRLPLLQALPLTFGLLIVSFIALTQLFSMGLWLSAALPLVAALPPLITAGALGLIREHDEARRSDRSLASLRRFHSPALAKKLENDPNYLKAPLARELVVFFVDLTGFTTLSQRLGPDGTRALLQRFHEVTTDAVEAHGGTVINYMGDGALAVFGLEPAAGACTEADKAIAAAQDLELGLSAVGPAAGAHPLACRIGLHYGPVILSRLGADNHQQVSVSGDTVNLTSRLLELAKTESARIISTSQFTEQLSAGTALRGTRRTDIAVRGRSGHEHVIIWPILPSEKV